MDKQGKESSQFQPFSMAGCTQECLKLHRPKTLEEVRQVTEAFAVHYNWQRPHQGISCSNQPPRVAFPTLPSLPPVPDVINPDAWLSRVKGQHLVRRVNRQGFVKVDFYPYSISSKLAGQSVTLSIGATEQELQVVYPQEYRRSLPRKQLTPTGTALSGVSRTHAAGSLHSTAFACYGEVENPLRLSSHLHTMLGSLPSDEVGKSYTHPVGFVTPRETIPSWRTRSLSRDQYSIIP